jgi:hypothetical protein
VWPDPRHCSGSPFPKCAFPDNRGSFQPDGAQGSRPAGSGQHQRRRGRPGRLRIVESVLKTAANGGASDDDAAAVARTIVSIIKQHHIVDVLSNEVAQNNMRNAIDDYFFDVVRDGKGIDIPVEQLDEIELQIMDVARARFPG